LDLVILPETKLSMIKPPYGYFLFNLPKYVAKQAKFR